jgi:hypothetical protein
MSDNVNIVRLITGEEIVCTMTTIDNAGAISYNLKDCAVLIPNPADGRLMFGRWLPYAKANDGITVDSRFVMFITEPSDDLKQHYVTTIVNNLTVPSKKLVEPTGDNKLRLAID